MNTGLNLGAFGNASYVASPTAVAPTSAAPAVAAFGPGGTTVVTGAPGVIGTTSGHLAVYFGIACFIGLVIIRQSLPK